MTNPFHGSPNVEGAGVLSGFRIVDANATVESSDGYLNFRAGPSSSHPVMKELVNGAMVQVHGCRSRTRGARWCLVEHGDAHVFGYVYDRELVYSDE